MADFSKSLQELEKRLESFKTAREWSDFISLLTSLDKTLKKIPEGTKLSILPINHLNKRLNQCLNPSLPAGVHNKVIQTFSIIIDQFRDYYKLSKNDDEKRNETNILFSNILFGIFMFARYTKIQTKTIYLDFIEKQIVGLDVDFNYYLRNILLALLPGLVEDGDISNRCNFIISKLYKKIEHHCFWNHFWNVFLSCPDQRISVINFIVKNGNLIDELKNQKDEIGETNNNNTIFYFLSESLIVYSIKAGLKDKNNIVIRGSLDILNNLFKFDDFSENGKIALLDDLCFLYTIKDIGINKRIDNFIDKNGSKLKTIEKRSLNYKINVNVIEEKMLCYDYMVLSMEKRLTKDLNELYNFFRILNVLIDKDEICDYIMNKLIADSLIKIFDFRNEDKIKNIKDKFKILYVNTDIEPVWFLIFDKMNILLKKDQNHKKENNESKNYNSKESNGEKMDDNEATLNSSNTEETKGEIDDSIILDGYTSTETKTEDFKNNVNHINSEANKFLNVIKYFIEEMKMLDSKISKVHLILFIILILKNKENFIHNDLINFILICLKIVELNNFEEKIDLNKQYNLIVEFYNEDRTQNIDIILNSFVKSLGYEISQMFLLKEDFETNCILLFNFIELFGLDVIDHKFYLEFYFYLCDYLDNKISSKNNILEKSLDLFLQINEAPIFKEILLNCERLYLILLENVNHEICYQYNIVFHRKFEEFLIDDFNAKRNLENIFRLLHFCITYKTEYYFYNELITINSYYINILPSVAYQNEDLDKFKFHSFLSSLYEFKSLFQFIIQMLLSSNISAKGLQYIDEPDTSNILTSFNLLKTFLEYSASFNHFLKIYDLPLITTENENIAKTDLSPKHFLYSILMYLFTKNQFEIQRFSIYLANLLFKKEILTADEILFYDYTEFFHFLNNNQIAELFLNAFCIIKMLYNTENPVLHEQTFMFLKNMEFKKEIIQEVIYFIFSLKNTKNKAMILSTIFTAIEVLQTKFLILKYSQKNSSVFDREDIKLMVDHMINLIIDYSDTVYENVEQETLDNFKSNDFESFDYFHKTQKIRCIDEITNFLFTEENKIFINVILRSNPSCKYLVNLKNKDKIYSNLLDRIQSNIFEYLSVFEESFDDKLLADCFASNFSKIYDYFNGHKNKLIISDFYIWYLKHMKRNPIIKENWIEFTNKIFEPINLLLSKCIDPNFKKFKTHEERNKIANNILLHINHNILEMTNERYKTVVNSYIYYLFVILKYKDNTLYNLALENFHKITKIPLYNRFWRISFFDYLMDVNFFCDNTTNIKLKMDITKRLLKSDLSKFDELLQKFEQTGFFSSKDTEISQKVVILKRLAFMFFCSKKDLLANQVGRVLQKMIEFINSGVYELRSGVYFLARHILYKIDEKRLYVLWPPLFSDINAFLSKITIEPIKESEYKLFIDMLKLLDTFFILQIDETIEIRWNIIDSYSYLEKSEENAMSSNEESFESKNILKTTDPLLLASKDNFSYFTRVKKSIKNILNDIDDEKNKTIFYIDDKKKPLLTIKQIDNVTELKSLLEDVDIYYKNTELFLSQIDEAAIVNEFIEEFIE